MAFSSNISGSFGRSRFQQRGALSDINVTPFVDVLLVLLVIFMLTAHVMESGIDVDVPAVKTTKDTTRDLPIVEVSKEGETYLGGKSINIHELPQTVLQRYGKAQTVYVRADRRVTWEIVAQVVAELGGAKIGVSVVTKPEDITRRPR
ncbi:MAG TPA: biopolymer transporter ExbD [Candidatus Solibacter sp.]|nr:biopolymer transporter ExbD [Candidatus Solibacter sp.]